jgi:hypothetical protein
MASTIGAALRQPLRTTTLRTTIGRPTWRVLRQSYLLKDQTNLPLQQWRLAATLGRTTSAWGAPRQAQLGRPQHAQGPSSSHRCSRSWTGGAEKARPPTRGRTLSKRPLSAFRCKDRREQGRRFVHCEHRPTTWSTADQVIIRQPQRRCSRAGSNVVIPATTPLRGTRPRHVQLRGLINKIPAYVLYCRRKWASSWMLSRARCCSMGAWKEQVMTDLGRLPA